MHGDAVGRVYAVGDHGGVVIVEVENASPEAIAVAFKDYKTDADWEKLDQMFRKYIQSL